MAGSTTLTRLHALGRAGSPPAEGAVPPAQHPFAVRRPASTARAHAGTTAAEPTISPPPAKFVKRLRWMSGRRA
jgi:hypothetical protein